MKIFAALLVGLFATTFATAAEPIDFKTTLQKHFAAIQARDLPALLATVTKGEKLPLILPNGTLLTAKKDYIALHTEWFKAHDWTMKFEIINTIETTDVCIATVRTTIQDQQPTRQSYLTLTFAREAGEWRLIHDQNTRIPAVAN